MSRMLSSAPLEILKLWHPTKNGDLTPDDLPIGSAKEVWWRCEKGHEWKRKVFQEVRKKKHCDYCSGRKLLTGFNDLATTHPELVDSWDTERNGITPDLVREKDLHKFWWICKNGHHYQTNIYVRLRGNGCPYCARVRTLPGESDLKTCDPEIMKFWDYAKNKTIDPGQIGQNSWKLAWWKCPECGASFQRHIQYFVSARKCPKCGTIIPDSNA